MHPKLFPSRSTGVGKEYDFEMHCTEGRVKKYQYLLTLAHQRFEKPILYYYQKCLKYVV